MELESSKLRLNNFWKIIHELYGHASLSRLRQIRRRTICFIPNSPPTKFFCEVCVRAKPHRTPRRIDSPDEPDAAPAAPLSKISSDVVGPFTASIGQFEYYCLFIDKATRYRLVYFLQRKSDVWDTERLYTAARIWKADGDFKDW